MKLDAAEPRIEIFKRFSYSTGADACFLASSFGLVADPWQARVAELWLAERKNGELVHAACGLSVPRQNGKNGVLEIVELYKMVSQGRRVLHTAHEVKTARKAFLRLKGFFETFPDLGALVKDVRKTNGQEAILLKNGGSCEFIARSKNSGRGFTVDDMIFDEAQELTDEQMEAQQSTNSAAPSGNPQDIYLGTPPGPSSNGTIFTRMRGEVLSGAAKSVCWTEFSIPDDTDPALAKRDYLKHVYKVNPALGSRIMLRAVEKELVMSAEGFCRERLGKWEPVSSVHAINMSVFEKRIISKADAPKRGRRVFGVRFSPDGALIGLAAALRPDDGGPVFVEALKVASVGDGTGWLVDFLVSRKDSTAAVVVDGKFGVGYFVQALRDGGFPARGIVVPTLSEVITAHSTFELMLGQGGFTTVRQSLVLDEVRAALKRPIGRDGGFGWQAPSGGSVVLLEAMTYALWGAKSTRRNPSRRVNGGVLII